MINILHVGVDSENSAYPYVLQQVGALLDHVVKWTLDGQPQQLGQILADEGAGVQPVQGGPTRFLRAAVAVEPCVESFLYQVEAVSPGVGVSMANHVKQSHRLFISERCDFVCHQQTCGHTAHETANLVTVFIQGNTAPGETVQPGPRVLVNFADQLICETEHGLLDGSFAVGVKPLITK